MGMAERHPTLSYGCIGIGNACSLWIKTIQFADLSFDAHITEQTSCQHITPFLRMLAHNVLTTMFHENNTDRSHDHHRRVVGAASVGKRQGIQRKIPGIHSTLTYVRTIKEGKTMKATRQQKHSNYGTAGIASACLILLNPLTGHASTSDEQLWTASGSGDLQVQTALVNSNAELVAARDRYGRFPLHYAAEAGRIEAVNFLLANGADIMAQDNRGWTALHYAVDNKQAEVMELLIAQGAKVDARNSMQWTPLHLAVLKKDKSLVLALIKHGADVYAQTSRELTPYNLAVDSGHRDIVDHLVAAMSNKSRQAQTLMLAITAPRRVTSR
jgi:hypothetical protein